MKSLINLRTGVMLLMLFLLSGVSARANVGDYVLSVREVTATTNTIEFKLYLLDDDDSQDFEFAALQMGLLLNSSIYGNGTLTVSYSNTDSELDGDQQFVNVPDVVAPLAGHAGKTLIRLMANNIPPVPPGAGSGTVISATGDGTLLAHFTISSTENFTPNSRAGLEFCAGDAVFPLYPTVVYSYIDGTSTALGVTAGVDAVVDGDPLLNPTLPVVFNVTGSGEYCVGGDGLPVELDGSEADATYTLYRNGLAQPSPISGTGAAISFGNQTEGTYTVTGTNVAGDTLMAGQAVITETPNNTITLTSGAGTDNQSVCISNPITTITYSTTGATGIGAAIGLPAGVSASWAANIITISGTPTESWTFNYTVPLDGGCGTVNATGAITVHPLPTITVSTAPSCSVDLLTYSLEVTVSTGTVTSSSGTVLALGGDLWSITGVAVGNDITVTVTDANTCDNTLSVASPDCSCPVVAAPVSGGDESYCAGSSIPSLTVSVGDGETADWYDQATGGELLLSDNTTYTPATPGIYYAEARVTANNCVSSTRTSVTLTENPLPAAIMGLTEINVGATTVLSSTPIGGTWSSSNEAIAVIDPGTGEVTGIAAGSTVVTYTLPTGCFVSTDVNVLLNEFTKSFPVGWSWFSTNVESGDMSLANVLSGCEADGNYIKDQFTSSTYFDGYGWFGYLTEIDPSRMYKINTTNNCTINFAGTPVDISNSIDLVTGWNWIGFLPQNELDINSALSSLSLTELDYIKNQINSATYFMGYGWFGYLTELVPGEGYMIRLANPGTLIYPDMPTNKSASVKKGFSPEQFNPSEFEYNASVSAGVVENFQFKVSEGDILIAYVNGQIRGIVPGLEFEPTGNYVFPIMVHSNREGEIIEFKYLNAEEDILYNCIEKIEFKSDMVFGDAINPFKLNVSLKSNDDVPETDIGAKLSCYPNPFTGMVSIEYFVPLKSEVRLTIYDSYGRVIKQSVNQTEEPGYKLTRWVSSGQPGGIYIIHLQIGEQVSVKKLTLVR